MSYQGHIVIFIARKITPIGEQRRLDKLASMECNIFYNNDNRKDFVDYACTSLFVFLLWGIPQLQSDWSLSTW